MQAKRMDECQGRLGLGGIPSDRYFDASWTEIELEIDGKVHDIHCRVDSGIAVLSFVSNNKRVVKRRKSWCGQKENHTGSVVQ